MTHEDRSLAEMHGSVAVPRTRNWFRRLLAFAGPAYLVSVGYMDPGNWATDLAWPEPPPGGAVDAVGAGASVAPCDSM